MEVVWGASSAKTFFFSTNSAGSQIVMWKLSQPSKSCPSLPDTSNSLCLWWLPGLDGSGTLSTRPQWGDSLSVAEADTPRRWGNCLRTRIPVTRGSRNCWQQQSGVLLQIAPRKLLQAWRAEWFSSLINRFSTLGPEGGQCKRRREA